MAGSAYDFIITGRDQSGSAFDSLKRNARDAEGALGKLGDPMAEMNALAGKAEALFKGFIGYEAISRFVEFHKGVQESVGALKSQADAVGYTTDALQAYQAAFRSANLNIEGGQTAIANLNVSIGRAAMGEKEAADAFQLLGVRILDQNGKVRDNTAILTEASRALLAIEDTSTRAAVAKTLFGKAAATLTPVLRETARGFTELDAAAKDAGQTVSRETIEVFDRLKNQAEATSIRIRNLYAELAAPVQLTAVDAMNRGLENFITNIKRAGTSWGVLVGLLSNPLGTIAGLASTTFEKELQDKIDKARGNLAADRDRLGGLGAGDSRRTSLARGIARDQAALDELEQRQRQLEASTARGAGAGGVQDQPFDANLPTAANKFAKAKPTGGEKRDRIGEEMQQLTGNVDAARQAYEDLRAAAATAVSSEDLQRQVELQKKIADELARIGKYAKDDPRVPQIKALVTEHERYEFQIKSLENALKTADATEKAFGDGKAALAKTQYDLNQALATGRLSQEAYTAANREAALVQAEQAAKAGQYKEGLDGLVAGMEYARAQAMRQNSAFNQGIGLYNDSKAAFSGFIQEVNNGLRQGADVWTTFGNAGLNALNKIADKLLQMATDQLFAAAFPGASGGGGGGGGLFGGILDFFSGSSVGGSSGLGTGTMASGGFAGFNPFMGGLAAGGPIGAGEMHLVGEEGPELFMPRTSGTIVPNDALGGGGINVTVQNTNYFGKVVSHAELEQQLAQVEQRAKAGAIAGVLDAKSRGGAYRSGMKR